MSVTQSEPSVSWPRRISPQRIGWMAMATAALTAGLIAYGSWVRVSASGLGCPDWPLCDDSFIPSGRAAAIESGHRWYAGGVMMLLAFTTFLAFLKRREYRWSSRILIASSAMLLIQAALGGVVVFTDLHPLTLLAHLALAMGIIALLTIGGTGLIWGGKPSVSKRGWHLLLGVAGVIMVGGSIVATQTTFDCSTLPFCSGESSMASSLHGTHRVLGVAVLIATIVLALRLRRRGDTGLYFKTALGVSLLIAAQITVGASAIALDVPDELRILHVGLAAMIWWGMVGLWSLSARAAQRPT